MERRRERKRRKRERTGDSPEKLAERHAPGETAVDRMLRLGGVDREGRFKRQLVTFPAPLRARSSRVAVVVGGGTPLLPPVTEDVPLDVIETTERLIE